MPAILVADDSAPLRTLVAITLRSQGWQVHQAATPAEALAIAQRERPDAILLDVVFEGEIEDGYMVCRSLKASPVTASIPVVILTARTGDTDRALAQTVGARAFLNKPFGPLDLLNTLRFVIDAPAPDPALGLYLIDAGRLRPEQLERALTQQHALEADGKKERLGEILVREGMVTQRDVEWAVEEQRHAAAAIRPRASRVVRVVIADDHLAIREGLRAVLSTSEGFSVIGEAADGAEALALVRQLRPDVAIIDHEMPKATGLEVLRSIRSLSLPTAVVMFSFDADAREAAIAAGAAVFLTKDVDPRRLVTEVRRAVGATRPEHDESMAVVMAAASRSAWSVVARQRRTAAVLGVLLVAYAGAYLVLEPLLGASGVVVSIVCVALAGALLGPEAGLLAAVLAGAESALLWQSTGHQLGEPVLTVGGNGVGFLALMGIGAGFGVMRVLRGRFAERDREVDALAQGALLLWSDGGGRLDLAAAAARAVIPADAVLLFGAVSGGEELEVKAAAGAPASLLGLRQGVATGPIGRVYAEARPRVANDLTAGLTLALVKGMRSALLVPVCPADQPARGVIVALSSRRNGFTSAHAATLSRFGASVWLAMRDAPSPVPAGELAPVTASPTERG